jgi:hypothetical protein
LHSGRLPGSRKTFFRGEYYRLDEKNPFGRFIQNINYYYLRLKKMIPLWLHSGRSAGRKSRHFLRFPVFFLFIILIIAGAAANPISPGQQVRITAQIIAPPAPSTLPGPATTTAMEWMQATPHAQFSDRRAPSTVVFEDSLWVIGGFTGPSTYNSDVWRSDDGITWTRVTDHAAFSTRAAHRSVVFDNKIWVIGGRDGDTLKPLNDVWYSPDGITWTQATPSAGFAPRWDFGLTIFDGRMWVIGGSQDGITHNDVWYSSDGVHWIQATPHAGFSPRMEPSAVVYDGKIWVTGGFDWAGVYNDVWTSDDGVKWTQVTAHAPFVARRYQNVESAAGKLWVIGGSDGQNTLNDLWYTTDGMSWTQVSGRKKYTSRYAFTTAVFNDRLWVIAGTSGNDVWYSDALSSTAPVSSPDTPQNPPARILVTKTVFPSSIKVGTDTVITITVLNRGSLPVHDVEILDTPDADFPVVDGITQFTIQSIGPNDARVLNYTMHAAKPGSFRLNRTAVMYADQDGNYHLAYSGYPDINVLPSLITPGPEDASEGFFQELISWINGLDPFA